MADRVKEALDKVRSHPVAAAVILVAVLVIGTAKAGEALDSLHSLWVKYADRSPAGATSPIDRFPSFRTSWRGTWSKPDGYQYDFVMHLDIAASDSVVGHIVWTLRQAPSGSHLADMVGEVGNEFVRGIFNREAGAISVAGYRVDNPALLAKDAYQFSILGNGTSFRGMTRTNEGTWAATITGSIVSVEEL